MFLYIYNPQLKWHHTVTEKTLNKLEDIKKIITETENGG